TDFFTQVRPLIAEAFYKKFDEATILNVDNPFTQSLQQSVTDEDGHVVQGDLNYDTLMDLYGVLNDADHDPNAFVSKRTNNSAFRGIVETIGNNSVPLYDRTNNTLDVIPVVNLKSSELEKGEMFSGDIDITSYSIPNNLNYSNSTETQSSS